jgi:hypothetical protein
VLAPSRPDQQHLHTLTLASGLDVFERSRATRGKNSSN